MSEGHIDLVPSRPVPAAPPKFREVAAPPHQPAGMHGSLWMRDPALAPVFNANFEPSSRFGNSLLNFMSENNSTVRIQITELMDRVEALERKQSETFWTKTKRLFGN